MFMYFKIKLNYKNYISIPRKNYTLPIKARHRLSFLFIYIYQYALRLIPVSIINERFSLLFLKLYIPIVIIKITLLIKIQTKKFFPRGGKFFYPFRMWIIISNGNFF